MQRTQAAGLLLIICGVATTALPERRAEASIPASWRVRPVRVIDPGDHDGRPRVRIEGYFAYTDGAWGQPLAPKCGAMDFFCRAGAGHGGLACSGTQQQCDSLCRKEWDEIALASRTGKCVAFAARHWNLLTQTIRPIGSPIAQPDPYDPVMGIATVPCQPEAPGPTRPDLSGTCVASAGLPSDAGATVDPAPTTPAPAPTAPAPTPTAPAPTTPAPTPTAPTPTAPAAGDPAVAPTPLAAVGSAPQAKPPAQTAACHYAGATEIPGGASVIIALIALTGWRRRSRMP